MKTEKFEVTGMTCSACVAHVEKSVGKLNGINVVQVNLLTNSMTVSYDEHTLTNNAIEQAVEHAGYQAHIKQTSSSGLNTTPAKNNVQSEQAEMNHRWWISLGFLLPLLYLSMGHMLNWPLPGFFTGHENALIFAFTQFLLTIPIVIINKKYFVTGFKTLFRAAPNMDSLIAIGSSAAVFYGIFAIFGIGYGLGHGQMELVMAYSHDLYFESAATILTLITLGKYLEARSKSRTTDSISRLMDLAPKTATVIKNNTETEIAVEDISVGDTIVVRSGQSIPVDGVIISGNGNIDESALTGESMIVYKDEGKTVMSASINKTGYFTFRATRVGNNTTLAQIISLVEEASASKAPISKLADKISGIFVPIVIAIALISTLVWWALGYPFNFALSIGIAVLVISCPCALGLATPVAIMVGTGKGAEHGILFKSAESLETAHKINTVVLDKTGTLTEGKPRITNIISSGNTSEDELLQIAYTLEKPSEHPLAEAIIIEAERRNITLLPIADFETIPGKGISARIDNDLIQAGNASLMSEAGIDISQWETTANLLGAEGKTPLYIARNHDTIGLIAVADVLKANSSRAVEALKAMGIEVIMLTGDHQKTAEYIQSQTGINTVMAEVMPQDKENKIRQLQADGKIVAMVGDGINDAPALTRAQVGIAIGAGTDIAIESADVVLMRSDLLDVVSALQLSKAVIQNIRQNLFGAFFYNIFGIPLAAGVFYLSLNLKLNPMFAAAAMSFSSVTVVLNALRLLSFKPRLGQMHTENQKPTSDVIKSETNNIGQQIKKEDMITNKTLKISGMSCGHCSARVEKVLNNIDGVEAKVYLESNTAKLALTKNVSDEDIKKAVDNIGYEVTEITD
ncbi:MAG: heavy metal translocating P-type ATPase [Bacteroidetes bacterium]|nr:heavy metal translocating P-type ATPase [Bacteroidota bacterium]